MDKYEMPKNVRDRRTTDSAIAADRYALINDRIKHAAKLSQRNIDDIALIAISKTYTASAVQPFLDLGHRHFGENRVQEAQEKWPALKEQFPDVALHLVGQLQSNKADDAVALFDSIHSVDRPSLVTALAKARDKYDRQPQLFIQVNIGDEAQKGGVAVAELPDLLKVSDQADLSIAGLMCIPPANVEAAPYFALLRKLANDNGVSQLSMGMSDDFETAIQCGATHIRVGSALFGPRS